MFVRLVRVWTAALGAVIGVMVGLTLGAPLGGMVVPMPWSGQAVCGIGIVFTLGAACVCTVWRCSVWSGTTFCCGIVGGATVCLCTGSAS
eukprot:4442876-Ditylum_brightwellii.AAC.1